MKQLALILGCTWLVVAGAQAQPSKHVILISIDGFRPEFYLDRSWPAPVMQQLKSEGVYAQKVKSVFPSYTYPSHAAMITGALPARSGIYYNAPFEPEGSSGRWNWFIKDIKVPTLWRVLKDAGLSSAAVEWPISVGDDITWNVPEIWDTKTPADRITETRKYATPGLIEEIELNATGKLTAANMNEEHASLDENAGRIAAYIFVTHKPNLLAVHFAGVDGAQHEEGREGQKVERALANADRAIGNILEAVKTSNMQDSTTILITGDHGFMDMHSAIRPNVWLKQAGLSGEGKQWKVRFQAAGGSAFLYVQNKKDVQTIYKVQQLLNQLPAGIRKLFSIYDRHQLDAMGADSSAILALAAIPGIVFSGSADGEWIVPVKGGHHGYDPNLPEMYTGFVGYGAGLVKGHAIAQIGVEDVAPLIAALLGVSFKVPDGVLYPGIIVVSKQ